MKRLLLTTLLLSLNIVSLQGQGSGTPSTLRVKVDANGYLLAASATQTNPVTQGTFNTRILKTDASGSLLVVLTGTVTPTYPLAIPASTCAAPSLGLAGNTDNGIAFTATPSILNCIEAVAKTTLTGSLYTLDVDTRINGGLGVNTAETDDGDITATGTIAGLNLLADNAGFIGWSDVFFTRLGSGNVALRNGLNTQTLSIGPSGSVLNISKASGGAGEIYTTTTTDLDLGVNNGISWRIGGSSENLSNVGIGPTYTTDNTLINTVVTWNNGAVAFTGWKLNVTDTASAAGSLLVDLQVGSVSQLNLNKSGGLNVANSIGVNAATPSTAGRILAGESIFAGTGSFLGFNGRTLLASSADGVIIISNNAESGFTRAVFGTNNTATSGFSFEKDSGGHYNFARGDGSTGTLTVANIGANSCGTSAATIAGTDHVMLITVGDTGGTACRVTFVSTWAVAPVCIANNNTTVANVVNAGGTTTTTVDVTGVFNAADKLAILCGTY